MLDAFFFDLWYWCCPFILWQTVHHDLKGIWVSECASFCCTDGVWDVETLSLLGFLTWVIFFSSWMTQTWFWIDLKVDLSNDLIRWLRLEHCVLWIFPLKNWTLDVALNDQTWRIVVIFEVAKHRTMTSALKICLATLKQMKLNFVLMKCIKTNDGIHDIIYHEECGVHDSFVSDVRDHLLTFDLDLSTIHIDKLTCVRSDWYMRRKRGRCYWCDSASICECCRWLLKILRETGTYGVRKWSANLFDPWIRTIGLSEVIDVESMTTESAYLARVRQNGGYWPIVCWCLTLIQMSKLFSCWS